MKIKMFNTRDEEINIAKAWADKNGVELEMTAEALTVETVNTLKDVDGISLIQVTKVDDALYPKLRSLGIKQIAQRSAGFDMHNLQAATENGIIISNVPSYSPESIAEFTVLTALNLIRKNDLIRENVREQNFQWQPHIRGGVLGSKKVAVLGTGRIGYYVAKFFKGFGCEIYGYDLYPNEICKEILTYVDSIEIAIKDADIVTLHMPATSKNKYVFDKTMFSKMKKGSIFLNMARGALVDTKALLATLNSGYLYGAGIDTYEAEGPYVGKDWSGKTIDDKIFMELIKHPRIVYSPHIAFYTDQSVTNLVIEALDAAKEIIETGTTKNRVN